MKRYKRQLLISHMIGLAIGTWIPQIFYQYSIVAKLWYAMLTIIGFIAFIMNIINIVEDEEAAEAEAEATVEEAAEATVEEAQK